jgi:hypothetical protein
MCGLVLTMRLRRGFLPVRLWRRTLDLELRKKSRKIVRWWPRQESLPAGRQGTLDLELRKKSRKIVRWWPRQESNLVKNI